MPFWNRTDPAGSSLIGLLREIQNGATDSNVELPDTLRRARILASRLDHPQFKEWVTHELDGYPNAAVLPSYRILAVEPLGTFVGTFGRQLSNAPIPPMTLPQDLRDLWGKIFMFDGVAYLESLTKNASETTLRSPIMYDFVAVYGHKIYEDLHAVEMWKPLPVHNIDGILGVIRNRLLGFALEIEREVPANAEAVPGEAPIPSDTVTHVYNTTILSQTGNVAVGSQHVTQTVNAIRQGDFDSLRTYLESRGVESDDIGALLEAVENDPQPHSRDRFGPNVSNWIGIMTAKAASGAWAIGAGAAGNLLSEALTAFYHGL